MSYYYFGILTLFVLIISILIMFLFRGDKRVFQKQTYRYWLLSFLIALGFGSLGFLLFRPIDILTPLSAAIIIGAAYFLIGIWYCYKRKVFQLTLVALRRWELPLILSIVTFSVLGLFISLWLSEQPFFSLTKGVANSLALCSIIGLLPFLMVYSRAHWNEIPIVIYTKEPWFLPLEKGPPIIEPSPDAIHLYFVIPYKLRSNEMQRFEVDVPPNSTLAQVFHHILYQHNIQERSPRPIEIAKDDKRSLLYGWLLYKEKKTWWRTKKEYFDMQGKVKFNDLKTEDTIFAERVIPKSIKD